MNRFKVIGNPVCDQPWLLRLCVKQQWTPAEKTAVLSLFARFTGGLLDRYEEGNEG